VVVNPVVGSHFTPKQGKEGWGVAPHLIITRNLETLYGIDIALQAFARVVKKYPKAQLSIAGSGPQLKELEELVHKLQLSKQVIFTGGLQRQEIIDLYRGADMMINASRADNAPNAILEAWAAGLPIVSTNVGGIPWLVDDGINAILVPVDQAPALSDAILEVLDRPDLFATLQKNGLEKSAEYGWQQVREQLLPLYQHLLDNCD